MKTQWIATTLIAAGLGGAAYFQQQNLATLRRQHAALARELTRIPAPDQQRERLRQAQALGDEMDSLRRDHDELMRLRQEATRLRANQSAERAAWEKKLSEAEASAAAAQEQTAQLRSAQQAETIRLQRVNDLKQLGLAARLFSNDNGRILPTRLSQITNYVQGIDLGPYEFFRQPSPVREDQPDLILLREKQPRQMPDGAWQRNYTLVDGSVQTITSPNDDFSSFESKHMARPGSGAGVDPVLRARYGLPPASAQTGP